MGVLLAYSATLETIVCVTCGIEYAFPTTLHNRHRETHENHYCPNGHQQHYAAETEAEKLRRELEQQKRRTEWAETENKKTLAKLKKTETRIAHGICPCCNRTFANLQRHMKTKHREFIAEPKK